MSPSPPSFLRLTSPSLQIVDRPAPTPKPNHLIISIHAASLNHRDLFARQRLYRGAAGNIPILADGVGTVIHPPSHPLHNRRVLLAPAKGWDSAPKGPERPEEYAILGGTKHYPDGTCQTLIQVPENHVVECPKHLSDEEAAAVPLAALTAWRATMVKAAVSSGQRVLITGIGGGVALFALQFAVAAGAEVWVSSSSAEKISKAIKLGAKGGVNYRDKDWEKTLLAEVAKSGAKGEDARFDAIIDGAAGAVIDSAVKICRRGGVVSSYGMTVGPKVVFPMTAVMANIEMRGSTMGSLVEFGDAVRFIAEKRIVPVVDSVWGFEVVEIEKAFEVMKGGRNFGKIVVRVNGDRSKL
jgi:NADPH:quinone reductase-like Zn-dependent oxidoreductase